MTNTPDSPAQTLDDRMILGGNFWTLFTPGIWKLLHAVLQPGGGDAIGGGGETAGALSDLNGLAGTLS